MENLLSGIFYRKIDKTKFVFHASTGISFIILGLFFAWGMKEGIFTSSEAFSQYMVKIGLFAPILFVLVQAVQVVIPILPGAIGCAAGVIAFGPVWGFVFNYTGICVGSIFAFLIAKKYGLPTVKKIVHEKTLNKYLGWLNKGTLFDKMFAIAIVSPVAPDDLLCYLAGLTKMSISKFTAIILIGKPLSILLYSVALTKIIQFIGM